jgi:hypothetical protein
MGIITFPNSRGRPKGCPFLFRAEEMFRIKTARSLPFNFITIKSSCEPAIPGRVAEADREILESILSKEI